MVWQRLSDWFREHVALVLVLVLVAGSCFLLGLSARPTKQSANITPVNSSSDSNNTSVVSDLQAAINGNESSTTEIDNSASPKPVSATSAPVAGLVHINTATVTELDTLPGIGPSKAQAIISYRTQNGPFIKVDDLLKVKGVGPKTLENLRSKVAL